MPVPSPVSAAESRAAADVAPFSATRTRATPKPLWPEALGERLWRIVAPMLFWLRSSPLYRLSFGGPVVDRLAFNLDDPRSVSLEDADGFMRGRFRLAGQTLEIKQGSIFDEKLPNVEFAAALHGFDWLRHLEAAGGDVARVFAIKLAQQWLKRYARLTRFVWRPDITAERFLNIFAHGRFFLANSDLVWRSRFFAAMRDQASMLARMYGESPDGLPRLKAAAALTLAGLCLSVSRNTTPGLQRLCLEIDRQILPDGGHVSRSPEALVETFRVLTMVRQTLERAHYPVPQALQAGLDRMAPALRFFRMGDGAVAVFNGGNEADARLVAGLLEQDETQARPLGHAPQSGYQRLASGRTAIVLDVGMPPRGAFAIAAHAGCLAFEMSAGVQRIVVNCGQVPVLDGQWDTALRATAAHSTMTLNDTSSASILGEGRLSRLLGRRLLGGPSVIETRRSERAQGLHVAATHDGYAAAFGIVHQRRLMLAPRGTGLTGTDRLIPPEAPNARKRCAAYPFAIRFHIHPDVRISLAQGGGSVLLKLPNGEGWRFRCGGALSIEESVYFGGGTRRRAEQLVIGGEVADQPVECAWVFEQVGSA